MNREVTAYLLLAEQCISDARSLLNSCSYRSAANRAYYGYFDVIRALLAGKKNVTKSHSAVRMPFGKHFVREGFFTRDDAKSFHELFLWRQNSDYDVDEDISETEVRESITTAAEFILRVEAYLKQNGFAA